MNISQSAYARIENGESNSWASYLERICDLFEVSAEELLSSESFILNQNTKGNTVNNGYIINQLSKKLISQYESRIEEKDSIIAELKKQLSHFIG